LLQSEVLRKAKDVLLERGWTKGTMYDPNEGTFCSSGAILFAVANVYNPTISLILDVSADPTLSERINTAHGYVRKAIGLPWSLQSWNDRPERNFNEVVDAFDKAEKLALIDEENP